jgi:hypothetical protein
MGADADGVRRMSETFHVTNKLPYLWRESKPGASFSQPSPASLIVAAPRQRAAFLKNTWTYLDIPGLSPGQVFSLPMNRRSSGRWNHRITVRLATILPLPKGEGRGEGERAPVIHDQRPFASVHGRNARKNFGEFSPGARTVLAALSLAPGFSPVRAGPAGVIAVSTAFSGRRKAAEAAETARPPPVTGLKPGADENGMVRVIS